MVAPAGLLHRIISSSCVHACDLRVIQPILQQDCIILWKQIVVQTWHGVIIIRNDFAWLHGKEECFMCAVIFCDPIAIPVQSNPVEAKAISSLNSLLYDVLPIRSPESPWKALVSSYPRSTKTASYKNFWRGAKAGWWSNDGRNYGLEKNWGWFSVQHKNGQSHLYQSYFRSGFQENIFQRHFPKFVISAGE